MTKCYLPVGDASQVSIFFSYTRQKLVNNIGLFSKLSLAYRVNVNH